MSLSFHVYVQQRKKKHRKKDERNETKGEKTEQNRTTTR